MNCAGLLYDDNLYYLDHLAPFCSLINCPLITEFTDVAKRYYPDLIVQENVSLPEIVIACADRAKLQAVYPNQNFTNLWLPHGNSDKGWRCTTFEVLEPKEIALVYGQKMIDFMSALHVKPETVMVGNFRRAYFEKHKEFYQKIIEKEISLPKGNKTFLYAPTWEDRENNGSFWALFPTLAETIPDDCNLIVKIHPNTVQLYEARIEAAIGKYKKKNILILTEFFPIYPLLSICDAYIGDMSSIGYDFLSFGRPMYFINASKREAGDPGLYLFRCGEELNPAVFTKQQGNFSEVRKQTYDYTFATVDYSTLMGGIMNTVCKSLRLPAAGYASIS